MNLYIWGDNTYLASVLIKLELIYIKCLAQCLTCCNNSIMGEEGEQRDKTH